MKCVACEKDLPKKETVYTESKEAYCINPFTCNENHPNSPQNIVARGNAMKLFTEKELDHYQTENLDLSQIEKEKIHRIVTKPMTVRINQVPLAYYLLQVQEEYGLGSLSESIRMCVEQMSIHSPIGKPLETKKPEEEQKESKPMQFLNATPVKTETEETTKEEGNDLDF